MVKSMSLNPSVTIRVINKIGRPRILHFVILFKIACGYSGVRVAAFFGKTGTFPRICC